ncbi:serine/arginine repetitive matrix protein 2-like isoform X3 [Limulus polyphemus]|uniref:Serine/arginine repetitive matrix protein 2-like isoform X3 n=1 Tax=Limulus polyphemus TaxID=6850 RepID=A0ABM1TJF5_LIMPO|nr:serine/arginine repetitive matrix protein 2-like isoform X3 [Limulus polyphemus]
MNRDSLHYAMWIEATRRLVVRTGLPFTPRSRRQRPRPTPPPHPITGNFILEKLWKGNFQAFLQQQPRKRRRRNNRRRKRGRGKTLRSVVSVKESHQMAEANQKKNEKLKEALGISEHFVEGSSLDPQRKQKEALAIAKAQKKYTLVRDSSSSSSPEREKKTKSTEQEEKDDEVSLIKKRTPKKHHQERPVSAASKNKRKTSDKRKKSSKDYEKKKKHHRSSSSESSSSSASESSSDSSYSSSSQFSSESSDPSDSSSSDSPIGKRYKQKHKKGVKKGHEKKKYEEKTKKKSIKEHKSHRETQENSKKHLSWHSSSCSVSPSPHSPKVLPLLNVDKHSRSARKHDSVARKSDKKSSSKRDRSSSTEISAYQQKIDKKRKASLSSSDKEETKKNKKKRRSKSSSSSSPTGSSSGEEELTKKKLYKKHHTKINESKWDIDDKILDSRGKEKIDRRYPKEKSQTPEREKGRDSRSLSYSPIPNSRSLYARSRTEADSTSKLNGKRSKIAGKYHDETSRSSLPERGEKKTDKIKEYNTKSPQSDYKFDYRRDEAQYISAKKDKNPSPRADRKEVYTYSRDESRYSKSQSISISSPRRKNSGHDSSSSLSSSHSSLPQKAKTFSKSDSHEAVSPTPDYQTAKKRGHSRSSSRSSIRSRSRSESHNSSVHSNTRTPSSRRSPSIPKRRGSPSFLEKRRITRSRSRSKSKSRRHHYSHSRSNRMRKARDSPRRSFSRHHSHDRHY